jgi:predicted site-specific integrase-resolvase
VKRQKFWERVSIHCVDGKRRANESQRENSVAELMKVGEIDAPTVCYARVSSHDQKEDLQRQQEWLTKPQKQTIFR